MSEGKVISLREFSRRFCIKGENLFRDFSLPVVVSASGDVKALYDYDLMVNILEQHIRLDIKPTIEKKFKNKGIKFKSCEMNESKIKSMLDSVRSSGDKGLFSDVLKVIYKTNDIIAEEYNLWGKSYLVDKIMEETDITKASAYHRVNSCIVAADLKPVAYSKMLTPVYDANELTQAYEEWVKNQRKLK
ncbi:hypothetical protein [Pseudomonas sp. HY7a-MNA-CIBAN-0227]|uniref:hypothetical protein n=1 Tax=Pseudomonas sp. HY7a-MNA-CIBAN-0227 TaxID=3140474 RepID=UPI00332E6471